MLDKRAIGIRNLTWHCVMIMETYTCIWTGRPFGIHDNDWDAEYPDVTSPELATLKYHIDLAQIIAAILRFGNRARQVNVESTVSEIACRLDSWWRQLDPDWKTFQFQERWNSKALMALMYHGAIILFHRMAYGRLDHPTCVTAAAAITTLIMRLEKAPTENECLALFPTVTYCAMMSCTVHLSQLLLKNNNNSGNATSVAGNEESSPTSADTIINAVKNLEKCLRVFDSLRGVFVDAETCSKTVLDFLTVKGIRLEDLAEAAQKSGISATKSDKLPILEMGSSVAVGGSIPPVASSGQTNLTGPSGGGGLAGIQAPNANSSVVSMVPEIFHNSNFFADVLARTNHLKRKQSNPSKPQIRGNSFSNTSCPSHLSQLRNKGSIVPSVSPPVAGGSGSGSGMFMSLGPRVPPRSTISNGSSADLNFMWDGLSLFDLAAFGGLANADSSLMGNSGSQNIQGQNNIYPSIQPIQQFQNPQQSQLQHQQQHFQTQNVQSQQFCFNPSQQTQLSMTAQMINSISSPRNSIDRGYIRTNSMPSYLSPVTLPMSLAQGSTISQGPLTQQQFQPLNMMQTQQQQQQIAVQQQQQFFPTSSTSSSTADVNNSIILSNSSGTPYRTVYRGI